MLIGLGAVMTSHRDDLERAIQDNLKLRQKLAGEAGKARDRNATPRTWIRHIGSTVALILGVLTFVAGVTALQSAKRDDAGMLIGAPIIILGALAYRSAKKRRLGDVKSTPARQILEIAALTLIVVMILALNNRNYLIATHPVMYFIVPVWAIVAYLVIAFMPARWLRGESMTS
jgi:hypothetical protein